MTKWKPQSDRQEASEIQYPKLAAHLVVQIDRSEIKTCGPMSLLLHIAPLDLAHQVRRLIKQYCTPLRRRISSLDYHLRFGLKWEASRWTGSEDNLDFRGPLENTGWAKQY